MSRTVAADPPEARTETEWPGIFLLFTAGIAVAFQVGKVPGALPFLKVDLGLTLFVAGWVVSIFNVMASAGGALFGVAADRMGHRRIALAGLVITAAAGIAGSFATDSSTLLVTRAIEGLGFILTVVAIPPLMLALCTDQDRSKAMGLWSAYMPTGMGVMLFASGPLLGVADWRSLWLIVSVLIGMVALAIALRIPGPGTEMGQGREQKSAWADFLMTARRPGPLLLGAIFATYAAQYLAIMAFLPLILVEDAGVAPSSAAMLGALAVASNIIGNLSSGFLLDRGLSRSILVIATSIVMAASGAAVFVDTLPFAGRYGCALVFSAIGGVIPGVMFAGAPVHAPRSGLVSSVNGFIMQGAAVGQLLGPPFAGFLVARSGTWTTAAGFVVAAAALTCVSAVILGRIEAAQASETKSPSAASSSSK